MRRKVEEDVGFKEIRFNKETTGDDYGFHLCGICRYFKSDAAFAGFAEYYSTNVFAMLSKYGNKFVILLRNCQEVS